MFSIKFCDEEFRSLLEHDGEEATIENNETDGYWNISFDDGYKVDAISDLHFKEID